MFNDFIRNAFHIVLIFNKQNRNQYDLNSMKKNNNENHKKWMKT